MAKDEKQPTPAGQPAVASPEKTAAAKKDEGVTLEKMRKFVRGEITLAQLENMSREKLYDFAELGYSLFQSGKLEEATRIFEGLVTYNPYDAYFHSALGAIYQKQKMYEQALKQYDLAIKLNPKDICSLTNRGETYLTLGKIKEAANDLKIAVSLDPQQKDPWAMRSRALITAIQSALGKKKAATPGQPTSATPPSTKPSGQK